MPATAEPAGMLGSEPMPKAVTSTHPSAFRAEPEETTTRAGQAATGVAQWWEWGAVSALWRLLRMVGWDRWTGGDAGNGGAADSGESCTLLSALGGNGGNDNAGGAGGNGGGLSLTTGSVTLLNDSAVYFSGGAGGNGGAAGMGGNAFAQSYSSLPTYTPSDAVTAIGGNGGFGNVGGNGGNGGGVSVGLGAVTENASFLYIEAGNGGSGGVAGTLGTGSFGSGAINASSANGSGGANPVVGLGGNGGSAILALQSGSLAGSSGLIVNGGNCGGGSVEGNGGNASVSIGSLNLGNSGSYLSVNGGGGVTSGTAAATIGTLMGNGYISMNGLGTSTLQVSDGNFSGYITGNVDLDVAGGGALTLTGTNNYTGPTSVIGSNSVLNIENAGNLSNKGLVLDGGTLQAGGTGLSTAYGVTVTSNGGIFDTAGLGSQLSGGIAGTGGFAVTSSTGTGALTLTAISTYSGATTVSGGALLNIQSAGDISANGLILNNGTLQAGSGLSLSNTVALVSGGGILDTKGFDSTLSGNLTGAGAFSVVGGGALTLTGYAQNTGSTDILNGSLVLGQTNVFGGFGPVSIATTGVLDLSNYSQQFGVLSGSGRISMGSGNLNINNPIGCLFSGTISGMGTLYYSGSAPLTLSGNNNYSGGTNIGSGALVVAGVTALGTGNVTVNAGALEISGPLTVNIGGNYTQSASGNLQIGLGPTTDQGDLLDISGAATLAGTLKLVPYSGYRIHDMEAFTILEAASVTGTFSPVTNLVGGGAVSLVYDSTEVVLDELPTAPTFADLGLTSNQKNIGGALDYLAAHSLDPALINYLNNQSNSALPGIYNQISPAGYTSLYRMGFSNAQVEAGMVEERLSQLFGNYDSTSRNVAWNGQGPSFAANLPASDEASMSKDLEPQHWGAFANGLGNFGTVAGDGNARSTNSQPAALWQEWIIVFRSILWEVCFLAILSRLPANQRAR